MRVAGLVKCSWKLSKGVSLYQLQYCLFSLMCLLLFCVLMIRYIMLEPKGRAGQGFDG